MGPHPGIRYGLVRRELARRLLLSRKNAGVRDVAEELLDGLHPKGRAFAKDKALLKAAFCTRRSGKTRGILRSLMATAVSVPGSRQVYINETRAECERLAWIGNGRDGLLSLNEDYGLGAKPNEVKLRLKFPNGSIIECYGADDMRGIKKLVGGAYHRIVIDEAQKMPHLASFILEYLGPAMMDYGGQIELAGTPDLDTAGFGLFYDITKEGSALSNWSVHRWSVIDNPLFGKTEEERYQNAIVKYCETHGLSLDAPEVQTSWFAKWILTGANYVYHVNRVPEHELCYAEPRYLANGFPDVAASIEQLPRLGKRHQWQYTLGVDLGFDPDPFAFVVWAWSYGHSDMFEVASWKKTQLLPRQQEEILNDLQDKLGLSIVVADAGGGGKGTVSGWSELWQERWGFAIEEAQKSHKFSYIEHMNGDYMSRRIRLLRGSPLHEESKTLTYAPKSGARLVENPAQDNHCTDAGLYGHRHTRAFLFRPEAAKPAPNSAEYWQEYERKLEKELCDDAA